MMNTIRRMRTVFVVVLGVLLVGVASASTPEVTLAPNVTVKLRGIAVAQELRSDYYIGAIYLPEWSPELVLADSETVPKRMQIKVLAERLSAREFQRHWKERIALNNPRTVWQPQGERILKFANAFRDNMQRGDVIEFDFLPGRGTTVRLNGEVITTIIGDGFYPLLLSAWLGEIPPTKAFQNHLRSGPDNPGWAPLTDKLTSLAVVSRPLQSVAPTAVEATRTADVTVAAKSVEAVPGKSAAPKPSAVASTKDRKVAETPVKRDVTTDKRESTGKAGGEKVASSSSQTVAAPSTPPIAAETAAVVSVPVVAEAVEAPTVVPAPATELVAEGVATANALEQDEDLLFGEYKREALRHIRKQLEYPARAWRLGLTGSGIVRAKLDRSGKLLSSEVVVSTGQMILDTAMTSMLERSLPLPPLPSAVRSDEVELDIPVDFVK